MKGSLENAALCLRLWADADLPAFAAMNADARVMEFMAGTLTTQQSDSLASRIRQHFTRHGFGLWALEIKGVADFAGFVGLSVPSFQTHFTPCVEIGWRLAHGHWGHGYATEAARMALAYGFESVHLQEIVSFTAAQNLRSRRVMEFIGMSYSPADDFDNPNLPAGHPLLRHVLYRLSRDRWLAR